MRHTYRLGLLLALTPLLCALRSRGDDAPPAPPVAPATQPARAMKHVAVDVKKKQVRVECEQLAVDMPLEFFCVVNGGPEHETVLRTGAKPSDIHFGLLMLGLTPGEPAHYSAATNRWFPPSGPPIHISCEWTSNGETKSVPAYRMMRDVKTKKPMPAMTWVFDGSRVMPDGNYAADITGYVVSIVNFDLTMIDVPELASNANETLEWELNRDVVPPKGTIVTMVIEPAGKDDPATRPAEGVPATQFNPGPGLNPGDGASPKATPPATTEPLMIGPLTTEPASGADSPTSADAAVATSEATMKRLHEQWVAAVGPRAQAMHEAAEAHYRVISQMRREQQKLINEADRIQRGIDDLEKQYQDMTTPHPGE